MKLPLELRRENNRSAHAAGVAHGEEVKRRLLADAAAALAGGKPAADFADEATMAAKPLPPAREVQERVDAGFPLCFGTGCIDGAAINRVLLVIFICLLMPFNCAAETPALPEWQHSQIQRGVDKVELSAPQQGRVNCPTGVVSFFAPVSTDSEPVPEKKAAEKSEKRENEQNSIKILLHALHTFLLGAALGGGFGGR